MLKNEIVYFFKRPFQTAVSSLPPIKLNLAWPLAKKGAITVVRNGGENKNYKMEEVARRV